MGGMGIGYVLGVMNSVVKPWKVRELVHLQESKAV